MDIQVTPCGQFRATEETGKAVICLVLVLQQQVPRGEGGAAGYAPHLTHLLAFLLALLGRGAAARNAAGVAHVEAVDARSALCIRVAVAVPAQVRLRRVRSRHASRWPRP